MKSLSYLAVTASLVLAGAIAPLAATALEVRLDRNGGVNLRLDNDRREVRPRVSLDGDRVNVGITSEPEPETEVNISEGALEIRRTRRPAESLGEFSIPLNRN